MMVQFTNFADQGVILPMIVLVAAALVIADWPRAAITWICVVPATLGGVLVGKMFVSACGRQLPHDWLLHSPSGHTASAAVVYGGLVALVVPIGRRGGMVLASALIAAALFGFSRLYLGVHTVADVIAGGLIGVAGASILVRMAGERPRRLSHLRMIGLALAAGVFLFHGSQLHAEGWVSSHAPEFWPFTMCGR